MSKNISQETLDKFLSSLKKLNQELKPFKVAIEQRGGMLCLRATLPNKDGGGNKQQRIPLGIPAILQFLKEAKAKALQLANEKSSGKFSWESWSQTEKTENILEKKQYIKDVERFKEYVLGTGTTIDSWTSTYSFSMKKIQNNIDEKEIFRILASTPKNSYARLQDYKALSRLIRFLEIPIKNLKDYRSSYKFKPRNIPSDEFIVNFVENFHKVPTRNKVALTWEWALKVCAAYGLRTSEIFFVSISDKYPYSCKLSKGKTGPRIINPLYPEWVEKWQLWKHNCPYFNPSFTFKRLGRYAAQTLKKYLNKNPELFPVHICFYDLRHAYAIRGSVKLRIPIRIMASFMGHSEKVHLETYSRWLSDSDAEKVYLEIINNK